MDGLKEILGDIEVSDKAMLEVETAYRQSPDGLALVVARAQGSFRDPGAGIVTLIREGAHLKAAPARTAAEKSAPFVCAYCGTLGNTNAENHYTNFPEHKHGRPSEPLTYPDPIPWVPPEKRSHADQRALIEEVRRRKGRA